MVALVHLLKPGNWNTVSPEIYFKAGGEVLGILFVATWIVTAIFNPSAIEDNPLYIRLGYPNLCVGFDTQPATSVGVIFFVFGAYLGFRFAWTDIQRTYLIQHRLSKSQFWFSMVTDVLYVLSLACFSLVFVLSPFRDGVWRHSLPFFAIIVGRYFVVVAQFYENDLPMSSGQKVFVGVYTFASFGFMLCVTLDFIVYDIECTPDCGSWEGPFLPWYLTGFLDYTWMICLPLTTKCLPHAEWISLTMEAVKDGDEVAPFKVNPEQIPAAADQEEVVSFKVHPEQIAAAADQEVKEPTQ